MSDTSASRLTAACTTLAAFGAVLGLLFNSGGAVDGAVDGTVAGAVGLASAATMAASASAPVR